VNVFQASQFDGLWRKANGTFCHRNAVCLLGGAWVSSNSVGRRPSYFRR
jgi:hypothetical protein